MNLLEDESESDSENEDEDPCKVDISTAMRAVPFITAFRNLKKICFGGCGVDNVLYLIVPYDKFIDRYGQNNRQALSMLIEAFAHGYQ
jgi:hypothetical protein